MNEKGETEIEKEEEEEGNSNHFVCEFIPRQISYQLIGHTIRTQNYSQTLAFFKEKI